MENTTLADLLASKIATDAFEWLHQKFGAAVVGTAPKELALAYDLLVPTVQWFQVVGHIGVVYKLQSYQVLFELETHLVHTAASVFPPACGPPSTGVDAPRQQREHDRVTVGRVRYEFARDYVGADTIPQQLAHYIVRCAGESADLPHEYKYPWISIVQSKGFGKSRMLRELAHRTKDDPHGVMKVLYTCLQSTGYPAATQHLRNYLFSSVGLYFQPHGQDELAMRLGRLYEYAAKHWDAIGIEWFQLFDEQAADARICKRLENIRMEGDRRMAGIARDKKRVVVLAIDETRLLLPSSPQCSTDSWYERLRHALYKACKQIRKTFGRRAGVFVVLVDADAKLSNSGRRYLFHKGYSHEGSEQFPPFVLTHTMDIRFEALV